MTAEIIHVHRVTLMWRMWREIGQTLRKFESEDDSGPKSKHEGLHKDQTVIIKLKQALEAPESHRDHARRCSINPELHTDVGNVLGFSETFPQMQSPCT